MGRHTKFFLNAEMAEFEAQDPHGRRERTDHSKLSSDFCTHGLAVHIPPPLQLNTYIEKRYM